MEHHIFPRIVTNMPMLSDRTTPEGKPNDANTDQVLKALFLCVPHALTDWFVFFRNGWCRCYVLKQAQLRYSGRWWTFHRIHSRSRGKCVFTLSNFQRFYYSVLQIGHVLNMMHDDNVLCRERFGHVNPNTHIMSALISHVDTDEPWSHCSREAITSFLSSEQAFCMRDRPRRAKV